MGGGQLCYLVLLLSLPVFSLLLYFMVKDFGVAKRDEDISFYAGFIGSISMLGRCLTAMYWGHLSDKYGRRPVMLAGFSAVAVFNALFGASTAFWMALLSQFLLGSSTNAILGPVKAYASEICSEDHQALGVAVVSTTWAFGLIIGPAVGGYLSQTAAKFPSVFPPGSLFDEFPYLLPCLACSAFCVGGVIVTWHIPETLHIHKDTDAAKQIGSKLDTKLQSGMTEQLSDTYKDETAVQAEDKTEQSVMSLLTNWPLMACIIFYAVWSIHDTAFAQVFSLWSVSSVEYGGLGFTTMEAGNVLTGASFALLIFQVFCFPPIATLLGPIKLTRLSAILSVPLVVGYQLLSSLTGSSLQFSALLAFSLRAILGVGAMCGSFLLLNNSTHSSQRGSANGLAISVTSFFKIIGPATGGILLSWAQSRDSSFLPGCQIVFIILGFNAFVAAMCTFPPFMPQSLDKPKQ